MATATENHKPASLDDEPSVLDLPDGRKLSYHLYGAAEGPAVVVLDGLGSRGLPQAANAAAREAGIRLIAPDRPGFGASTPVAKRRFDDWPADHAALLDALEVDRAGILAQSGGTPFGLAAAAALPERTTAVAFTGAIAPLHEPGAAAEAGTQVRRAAKLARRAPWLLRTIMRGVRRQTRKDPEKAARKLATDLPPVDTEILADPDKWAIHVRATSEVVERPAAVVRELGLLATPWELDLSAVRAPVAFWTGDKDVTHPVAHARRLAGRLADARVTVIPDAGTIGLMPHYGEAVRFAAGVA